MKRLAAYLLLSLFLIGLFACEGKRPQEKRRKATTPQKNRRQLEVITVEFTGKLKNALIRNMQQGGPVQALAVCADSAQKLTGAIAEEKGIEIKRVSLRFRNPNNRPDEFETRALLSFNELKSKGELKDSTYIMEVRTEDGQKVLRYMKPIIMQPLCLNCHGDNNEVSPQTAKLITNYYPDDRARNFSTGDIRGAVSIRQVLF